MDVARLKKIEIEAYGETLAHHFAELRDKEFLDLQRKLDELSSDGDTLKRILAIYDARCARVEGYEINEAPDPATPCDLMQARPNDWREFIPAHHKVEACLALMNAQSGKIKTAKASE